MIVDIQKFKGAQNIIQLESGGIEADFHDLIILVKIIERDGKVIL